MDKPLAGRHILVVEDEMMILMMIETMLADLGCESVKAAATVEKALALIDTEIFDAAMLDVNLGGEDSYPVADALVARGVPFAFSTGYGCGSLREGYRDRPALTKPYQDRDLAEVFTRLVFAGRATAAVA